MKIPLAAALVLIGLTYPAYAQAKFYTAASFLQDDTVFATGYAWGVVSGWLAFPGVETAENLDKIGQCLAAGNITSGVMVDAVREAIRNDPALLPQPASQAVLNTLYVICPVR